MSRSNPWLIILLLLAMAPLTIGQDRSRESQVPSQRRLNVLFIAVDDLRPELGCYGKSYIHSPNIDALAKAGMLFERGYCQQAVCAPSRASLLSGCRPDTTRVTDLNTPLASVRPDLITLPRAFKQQGYTTISLGKIYHHVKDDDPTGWSEEPWRPEGGRFPWWVLPENQMPATGTETRPPKGKRGAPVESADVEDDKYPDGQTAARAIHTLRRLNDSNKPFFLAVGFLKPHLPFACPKKYFDLYDLSTISLPPDMQPPKNVPPIAMTNFPELRQYRGAPAKGPVSDAQARELIRGYYACVSQTDAQVGKLLAELDRLHLRQGTIVVLLGDHGWHLGDHGLWSKHTNFENAVHAPLIVSAPGFAAGQKTSALVELVDLFPSLCELANLPAPGSLEGSSFVPLLSHPDRAWKPAAFSQFPHAGRMGRSVTDGRFRYTRWENSSDGADIELYDHQSDPQEDTNVASDPARSDALRRMSALLDAGWKNARVNTRATSQKDQSN
jgi:arylsulfatase A-like enzyme